jgi:hypothetical protein
MFRRDRLDPGSHTFVRRRQRSFSVSRTISSSSLSLTADHPGKLMVSPRSGSYERLESGMGPSRLGVRNFTWRRVFLSLALVVTFVWFLSPTEPKKVWGGIKTPGEYCAFTRARRVNLSLCRMERTFGRRVASPASFTPHDTRSGHRHPCTDSPPVPFLTTELIRVRSGSKQDRLLHRTAQPILSDRAVRTHD